MAPVQPDHSHSLLRCHIQTRLGRRPRRGEDCQPTFPEFVDYLLEERAKGKAPNEHWAPYHSFCSPCQLPFDYVLRFESLLEEEAFLIQAVPGLSTVVHPRRLHSSHTDYEAVTKLYFSQLSRTKLAGLYEIYKRDFEIFDYDATPYFAYAKASHFIQTQSSTPITQEGPYRMKFEDV
ncbi:carbohydrate sulfotransferase 11-like [Penaeus chinensis]|uniref:carbohydrate sulfotransferase 11-like n=1 Tax=Penaeus chinensis TaxID=139456 RepID=UPI001FB5E58E|nr:carbohydrate sulfotransferase 11-like [Penaeus chinensis]